MWDLGTDFIRGMGRSFDVNNGCQAITATFLETF